MVRCLMIHSAIRTVAVFCALALAVPAIATGTTPKKSTTHHTKHKTTAHSSSGTSSSKKSSAHKKTGSAEDLGP